MAERLSGRLELTWTNKDLRLLAHEDGTYEWVPPADYRVAEVRLLHEAGKVGETHANGRRAKDNLMIRGDALAALRSLVQLPEFSREVVGHVLLAYLDPPFNTQQAFAHYDDGLEHSVWLTMMRDRLKLISDLLAPEGSVWVHLDDTEMPYCRVMMDELFGRENFVASVIWEKADSPRNSARWFSTDHDYILVYARNGKLWRPNRLARTEAINAIYLNPDDDVRGPWLPGDPYANKPYSRGRYKLVGPSGRTFQPPPGRYWRVAEDKFRELDADGRIWWGPKGNARPSIKRYLSEVRDLVPRTLWSRNEVGSNRTSKNEMRRLFAGDESFATPKPELLMQRIIEIATQPGELVLDCFAGSGTTAAVAQKLGRPWITSEWSRDSVERFTLPRLEKVVAGDDPGGVTEAVGWKGGGGFRVLDVAPSMFEDDEGLVVLVDWATQSALAEATAAQLGFSYEEDQPFVGRKGRMRLAVVDGLVSDAVINLLLSALPEGECLTVCGTTIDDEAGASLRKRRPGSRIRKIPASILAEYQQVARWRPTIREPELRTSTESSRKTATPKGTGRPKSMPRTEAAKDGKRAVKKARASSNGSSKKTTAKATERKPNAGS